MFSAFLRVRSRDCYGMRVCNRSEQFPTNNNKHGKVSKVFVCRQNLMDLTFRSIPQTQTVRVMMDATSWWLPYMHVFGTQGWSTQANPKSTLGLQFQFLCGWLKGPHVRSSGDRNPSCWEPQLHLQVWIKTSKTNGIWLGSRCFERISRYPQHWREQWPY